ELARAQQRALIVAGDRLGRNTVAKGPDAAAQASLANWLVQHCDLLAATDSKGPPTVTKSLFAKIGELDRRAQWESKTAVAWFDGTGVDENVLIRGKATRKGALAPRGLPVAFPGAAPIRAAGSSGRYELALE